MVTAVSPSLKAPGERDRGRPSIYPGKDVSWHATAYFTAEGRRKLAEVQELLLARHEGTVQKVSVSDAIEEAIHHLHRELTGRHDNLAPKSSEPGQAPRGNVQRKHAGAGEGRNPGPEAAL